MNKRGNVNKTKKITTDDPKKILGNLKIQKVVKIDPDLAQYNVK